MTSVESHDYEDLGDGLKAALQSPTVEGKEGVQRPELYKALDDHRKAGLINVYTKMKRTVFENSRDCTQFPRQFRLCLQRRNQ